MKHFVKHHLHQGDIDDKQANNLLGEIYDKLNALRE
jgi:hypothetical protein